MSINRDGILTDTFSFAFEEDKNMVSTEKMSKFKYDGPVMAFGNCISNKWSGSTYAVSKKKAESNLIYQFKKNNNMTPDAMITLPGKVREV